MNWLDAPLAESAAAVQGGKIGPVALTSDALARAAARNPAINAICATNPRALEDAEAVAKRLSAGETLPLAGIPVLIKDNIWVKGLPITQGSRLFANHTALEDAEAVRRLRHAGAVIIGIATCSEFACKGATNSPQHGITRNPVDPSLTPGGSSGGSVAAVAAGIVPLALGTDAGGSSRRPPAHTGLCGLKPSQDLVPYGPGFDEPVWGISVICPIARRVADISLAMQTLAGLEPSLATSAPLQLAVSRDFGTGQRLDPEVASNFESVLTVLSDAGVTIAQAEIDWGGLKGHDIQPLQYAGLAQLFGARWCEDADLFDPALAQQIEAGMSLTGVEVAAAHQNAHKMRETLRSALDRYGMIATPCTPCAAWTAEDNAPSLIAGLPAAPRDHAAFTPQINHAGVPAISLPCGTDGRGRPLGLQIIAAAGQDAALIAMAQSLEPLLKEIP